jgi:hypothetical protein
MSSGQDLFVSYVVDSFDFWQVAREAELYWPRFVRVREARRFKGTVGCPRVSGRLPRYCRAAPNEVSTYMGAACRHRPLISSTSSGLGDGRRVMRGYGRRRCPRLRW